MTSFLKKLWKDSDMDFELSEEHRMIQSLARDFVNEQLKPLERDLLGRSADMSDARADISDEHQAALMKTVMDMGLWNAGVPEEFGGAGLDTVGNCLVEEELARTVVPFSFGDVTPVLYECSEYQREKYLAPALRNEKRPYLGLFENEADMDLKNGMMQAEPDGEDYLLNGRKLSLSRRAKDYFAVVFARTSGGMTCFLVDRDTPGFAVNAPPPENGWKAQKNEPAVMLFDNCRVRAENILGEVDRALRLGKHWLQRRRIIRSARALGVGRRLLEEASSQAQSQTAFGKLAQQRASVQAAIADIAVQLHSTALTVYESAWKADLGRPIAQAASVARLATNNMLHSVADSLAHIVNGPGFFKGQPMERLCRRILQQHAHSLFIDRQRFIIAGDVLKGITI